MRLGEQPAIEDLRNHPTETVEKLRQLLSSGAPAKPDPRRKDFYELENGCEVFYIHISPVNGKVLLLATWLKAKPEQPASVSASHRVA